MSQFILAAKYASFVSASMLALLAFIAAIPVVATLAVAGLAAAPTILTLLCLYRLSQYLRQESSGVVCFSYQAPVPFAAPSEEIEDMAGSYPFSQEDTCEAGYSDMAEGGELQSSEAWTPAIEEALPVQAEATPVEVDFAMMSVAEPRSVVAPTPTFPVICEATMVPDSLPTPAPGSKAHDTMTNEELVAMAKRMGIKANIRWKRATLIAKISEKAIFAEAA